MILISTSIFSGDIVKMDLYLEHINQEMIDASKMSKAGEVGKAAALGTEKVAKSLGDKGRMVDWTIRCCILNFKMPDRAGEEVINPQKGYFMRMEKEGGMIWDARTGAVYKLDEEAYHTLLEAEHGSSDIEIARRMNLPLDKVKEFMEKVRRLG
jgi:hypothetical protein